MVVAITASMLAQANPASAADTLVYSHLVNGYDADGNPETDSMALSYDPIQASVAPSTLGLTATNAGECRRITATSKYVAPAGTMWTYTSGAFYCFKRGVKITYFRWETPDGHVTKLGQLGGWQYTGNTQSHSVVDACRHHGLSTGHFKQTYPFGVGVIARVDAGQSVVVTCRGGINWA